MKVFLISFLFLASTPQVEEITFEVSSLKQSDLPDDFPWLILNEGFAVLQLRIKNGSSGIWTFDPGEVEVFESGGKTINRAAPTEITPQIMKFYRGGQLGIYAEAYSGGRPTPEEWDRVPTVEPGARAGTVSVNVAQRLLAALEHYQLKQVEIAPGDTLEGFLYLKSKKTGSKLSGSSLRFQKQVSIEIP